MKKISLTLVILMAVGSVMAGTLTKSTTPPTNVFASGGVDAPSFTRVFADGSRPTDYNEGRGNEIISDSGESYAGYTMSSLVIRKDAPQDFTGSTATLTLYVFEGTKEQFDAGNGQSAGDNDPFDGTGITNIYTETFALNGNYAEGDYITLALANPITMASQMNFFIKMDKGDSANTYFQIAQRSNPGGAVLATDGWQYQSPSSGNKYTGSPLEYYAVGANYNIATNFSPTGDAVDPATATTITWDHPVNYTPEVGYDLFVRTADPNGSEPNFVDPGNIIEITDASATSPTAIALDYGTTYYCKLTAYDPNGISNDASDDTPYSIVWSFTTMPADTVPVVTVSSYVIWPDLLPFNVQGAVEDNGEGDIASVTWEIIAGPGIPVPADMKMMNRTALYNIMSPERDLFRDWIGTDSAGANEANSDVLKLTLSGLPAGEYTWTSYHYDAVNEAGITGVFDVTVNDSTGSNTTTGVAQYSGPVAAVPFTTTITSDGSDVALQFVGSDEGSGLFMMNGLELTSTTVTGDPLFIDFGPDPNNLVEPGYQAYFATDGVPETFTGQDFSAFGTTVTVTPDWYAPGLAITSTGGTVLAPTATVNTTDAPKVFGSYTIQVTATENTNDGQTPQAGSETMQIQVGEDTCAAAQLVPGFEFDVSDIDHNCVVDLMDFATLAGQWLNDIALTEPATY